MQDWMEDGLPSRDSTMTVTMTANSRHDDAAMTVTLTDDDSPIELDDRLYSYAEIAGLLSTEEPIKANTIAARWFPNKVLPAYDGLDCPPPAPGDKPQRRWESDLQSHAVWGAGDRRLQTAGHRWQAGL